MRPFPIAGQIVTALSSAAFLSLDLTGYSLAGDNPFPWQVPALIMFAAYVAISAYSQWSLSRQLHEPEMSIVVDAKPEEKMPGQPFHEVHVDPDTDRLLGMIASMRLSLRNRDVHPRTVTGVSLEFRSGRRWYWPFSHMLGEALKPDKVYRIGDNGTFIEQVKVDWQFHPSSLTCEYHVFFQHLYPWGRPGQRVRKRHGYRAFLVIEVGSPDHVQRVPLPDWPTPQSTPDTSSGQP